MVNYFLWKGEKSTDRGLICSNPHVVLPQRNVKKVTVPGRSGFLSIDEGSYGYVVKSLECRLLDDFEADGLMPWLSGYGEVIFSDEPDKLYRAGINSAVSMEYMLKRYRAFVLNFDCQPFKYSVNKHADTLETAREMEFYGKGNYTALPVITVYGYGDINLFVNGTEIKLSGVTGYITIDSEQMDAYMLNENKNMKMTGDFPELNPGGERNFISFTGNVSKVEIKPNWRWL